MHHDDVEYYLEEVALTSAILWWHERVNDELMSPMQQDDPKRKEFQLREIDHLQKKNENYFRCRW